MAAKERSHIRFGAWLAPLLFLAATIAAPAIAPAQSLSVSETRVWQNPPAESDLCPTESPQVLVPQRADWVIGDKDASESLLAPEATVTKLSGDLRGTVSVKAGHATLDVDFMKQVNTQQINQALQAAKAAGAKTATIRTGSVINEQLETMLRARAADGRTLMGGVVKEVPGPTPFPEFEIQFENIPD